MASQKGKVYHDSSTYSDWKQMQFENVLADTQ